MWFSGLRGAVAYALAMHLNFGSETRHVIVTTTLLIVLLTIVVIGGSTMPMMRYLERTERLGARTRARKITLSKTKASRRSNMIPQLAKIKPFQDIYYSVTAR